MNQEPYRPAAATLWEQDEVVRIIACTIASLDAEDEGGQGLARCLEAADPTDWPPEHNDAATRDWIRGQILDHPDQPGWGMWYILAEGRPVGICGYKGPPDPTGCVEIGYSVVAGDRRRGFAGRAVALLVARAFRDPRVATLAAETLPDLIPSQRVLIGSGFALANRRLDADIGEIIRFTRHRLQPT